MPSLLSIFFDNLVEEIDKVKVKDCKFFSEYKSFKNNLPKRKCLSCNKNYSNKTDDKN